MARLVVVRPERIPERELVPGAVSRLLLTNETAGTTRTMLAVSRISPGTATPVTCHAEEELCYVLAGSGRVLGSGCDLSVEPGSAIYIPAGIPHSLLSEGPGELVLIYVFPRPSYPQSHTAEDAYE